MRNRIFWIVAIAVVATLGVVWLTQRFPGALDSRSGQVRLVANLGWLALLVSSLVISFRARPGLALRHAAIWVALGAALVLAYSFRDDAANLGRRLTAELLPATAIEGEGGAVSFRARSDGHFDVEADVDGTRVRFLVDTGASSVVLSPADARRLGFDLEALSFTQPAETANGIVYGAAVRLGEIRVGGISVRDVRATVNAAGMGQSLLGMSFLGRLSGYEVSGATLTLRP